MSTRAPVAAPRRAYPTRCGTISFAALLLLAGAGGAAAQTVPSQGQPAVHREGQTVRLEGRVLSAKTGQPLPFARVELPELKRRTTADAEGRFRIDRVPAGEHLARAELIGYRAESAAVLARAGAPVELRLSEDAVVLEALTVTSDRFASRLRAVSYPYRVLDRKVIAGSGASDVRHLIATRGGLLTVPCGRSGSGFCVRIRGAVVQPRVFVDEAYRPAGADDLALMSASEISRVEVLRGGLQIRVFTEQFTEWAARNDYRPQPYPPM